MTTSKNIKTLKDIKKELNLNTSTTSDEIKKKKQTINNYKARLEAAGVNVKEAQDDRNFIEKLLNLKQNQGFLGDVFEVLNRPQQALFGGWKAAQEGGSFGEGALSGLTGNEETQFKDILKNYGMSDREGKLDLVDVAGFLGDVFLDPADLIPVAGFKKAANVLDDTGNLIKAYKATDSVSDLIGKGVVKGAKGGIKLGDKGVEKVLTKLDNTKGVVSNTGEKVLLDYANKNAKLAGDLQKTVKNADNLSMDALANLPAGRLETYKSAKNQLENMFKVSDNTKNAIYAQRNAEALGDRAKGRLAGLSDEVTKGIDDYAKLTSKNADDVAKDITLLKESKMDRSTTNGELLDMAREGNLRGNKKIVKNFENLAENATKKLDDSVKEGLDLSVKIDDNGKIVLGSGWDEQMLKKNNVDFIDIIDGVDKNMLDDVVNYGDYYTKEDKAKIKELKKLYKEDNNFKELYDKTSSLFDEGNKIIDEEIGTGLANKYTDNASYVPQTLADTEYGYFSKQNKDAFGSSIDTNLLKSRSGLGSMRERNEWYRQLPGKEETDLFNESIVTAFNNNYLSEHSITNLASRREAANRVLLKQTFGNSKELVKQNKAYKSAIKAGDTAKAEQIMNEMTKATEGSNIKILRAGNSAVPVGYTKIDRKTIDNLAERLNTINKQLGGGNEFKDILKFMKANPNVAINSDIARMFFRTTDEKQLKGMSRIYDKWLQSYKKWKLTSPTYLLNNLVGNSSNLYLSGMGATDIAKLSPEAYQTAINGNKLYTKMLKGVELTDDELKIAKTWENYRKLGFGSPGISAELYELPEDIKKILAKGDAKEIQSNWSRIKNAVPAFNSKMNEVMDDASRITVMLHANSHPEYLSKLGVKNAQEAISKVMFDPAMMTEFERTTMKNIVPFYTYAKNNIVYQIDNLGHNMSRYNKTMKAMKDLQKSATGNNEENMADYIKTNMYIPVPGLGKDGSYTITRLKLPMADMLGLSEEGVLDQAISPLNPLLKAPIELATGKNSFTGRDIESFPGENSENIRGLTKKQEYLLGTLTGFDVPLKTANQIYNGIEGSDNKLQGFGQGLLNTVTMSNNVDSDKLNRQYDEISQLQNLIKQYEQKGYKVSTINELKNANKNSKIGQLNSIFAKYGIGEENKKPWEK